MVPTKVKDLIPEVAKDIGIPQDHLEKMYMTYLKENKKKMEELKFLRVNLKGLGIMHIKGWDIEKEIVKKERNIGLMSSSVKIEVAVKDLDIYKAALVQWNKFKEERKQFREMMVEYKKNKLINNDTEGQTTTGMEE